MLKYNPLVTIYEYDADHAFARGSGSARCPCWRSRQMNGRASVFYRQARRVIMRYPIPRQEPEAC